MFERSPFPTSVEFERQFLCLLIADGDDDGLGAGQSQFLAGTKPVFAADDFAILIFDDGLIAPSMPPKRGFQSGEFFGGGGQAVA